ncbi:hypothetical protein R6Q59_018374 [Mikania micrantha]
MVGLDVYYEKKNILIASIINEKGSGPVCVESIGGTSAAPGDGLHSTPLQMYSPFGQMNDKKKDS